MIRNNILLQYYDQQVTLISVLLVAFNRQYCYSYNSKKKSRKMCKVEDIFTHLESFLTSSSSEQIKHFSLREGTISYLFYPKL